MTDADRSPPPIDQTSTSSPKLKRVMQIGSGATLAVRVLAYGAPLLPTLREAIFGDLSLLWQTFILTFPLTVAVAIVIKMNADGDLPMDYGGFLRAGLILVGTTVVSNALAAGAQVNILAVWKKMGGLPRGLFSFPKIFYIPALFVLYLVVAYYEAYGFGRFASSLILGGFLGWVWVGAPYPQRKA